MSKHEKKEEYQYHPVMRVLQRVFSCLGDCHLEITAKKGFSNELKKAFDDVALYMIAVEQFFPDITGFVKTRYSTDIITVEVKLGQPMIKDIFQAKDYAQIFNAKYAILVSLKAISEERRRLILKRREIVYPYSQTPITIARFDSNTEEFEIDKELYYGSLPEPFETHRKITEAEKLKIGALGYGRGEQRTMYVLVTNIGEVAVKIVEARLETLLPFYLPRNATLKPGESRSIELLEDWVEWSKKLEWESEVPITVELVTENGKKFLHETVSPRIDSSTTKV